MIIPPECLYHFLLQRRLVVQLIYQHAIAITSVDMISVTLNMTLNGELALPLETEKHSQVV